MPVERYAPPRQNGLFVVFFWVIMAIICFGAFIGIIGIFFGILGDIWKAVGLQ